MEARRAEYVRLVILEKAVSDSPGAGVARYELAHLYDLEGYHVRALRLHAINRSQYRRFWRGRYRFGMSLEMIANPAFRFHLEDMEATDMRQSLQALDRCGLTQGAERIYNEFVREGLPDTLTEKLPCALREKLLTAAQNELRIVRRQLTLRRVIWAMFWHRDERMIRKPYWRLSERQSFHDGARVAELLVAVRQSLLEEELGRARTNRDSYSTKRAMNIVTAITGDSAAIRALLNPTTQPKANLPRPPGANAGRTRWLPWQCRTPSWEAAYNAACLYAALEQRCGYSQEDKDHMAELAVLSLTRAVTDRDRETEPPWRWISTDPDLAGLTSSRQFSTFLNDLVRRDYPTANPELAHH